MTDEGPVTMETGLDEAASLLVKKHKKDVDQIIQWESEADSLTGEADGFRSQAAGLIVKLLESGATERAVAQAIGKHYSHVHHAKVAWTLIQGDNTIPDFNTAYKMAKRPRSQEESGSSSSSSGSGGSAEETEPAEAPFPAWSKQVRELKRITAEMIDQASLKQVGQLANLMEKVLRQTLSKQQDMEYEQEHGKQEAD